MQSISPTNIKGVDVSKWQGDINWSKVASDGVKFAFIKATQGIDKVDVRLKQNATNAHKVGIKISYYHFAEANLDPIQQVKHFTNNVSGLPCDFPYVLDLETSNGLNGSQLTSWALKWLQEVERLTSRDTMIYSGAAFAKNYFGKELGKYPLWVAHYGQTQPMSNSVWDKWSVFQYSQEGKVNGISGNVDLNWMEEGFFYGGEHMLKVEDANKMISLLSALYEFVDAKDEKSEMHRLANALREASGQKLT